MDVRATLRRQRAPHLIVTARGLTMGYGTGKCRNWQTSMI